MTTKYPLSRQDTCFPGGTSAFQCLRRTRSSSSLVEAASLRAFPLSTKAKPTSRFTLNSFHSLPSSVHCRSSLCLLRKETPTHPFSLYLLQGPVLSPRLIPVQSPLTLPDKPGNGLFPPHTQGPNGPQPLPLLLTAPHPPTLRSCLQACPVPAPTQATPSIHS